ncbi:MAG: SDR family oxidoreductase [Pseudonocardiales bacterium]
MTSPAPTAVITGAANGIGAAAAARLATAGYRLLLVDRDHTSLAALVDELNERGADATAHPADVSQAADVQAYVDHAHDLYGRIDAFFNNAGIIGLIAPLVDYPETVFDDVIAVNLRGVFLGLKYVLPGMYERRAGAVVNTTSVAGQVGHLGHAGYVASKHAVVGLTKVAGAEAAPYGVRVNAVAPGPVRTDMIESIEAMKSPGDNDAERRRLLANIPAHRYGTAEEVASAVTFLLSGEAHYLNGTVLTIDGAFTAVR